MDSSRPIEVHEIMDSPINCDTNCPRVKELVERLAEAMSSTNTALEIGADSVKHIIDIYNQPKSIQESGERIDSNIDQLAKTVAELSEQEDTINQEISKLKNKCRGPVVCEGIYSAVAIICNSPQIPRGESSETCTVYRKNYYSKD